MTRRSKGPRKKTRQKFRVNKRNRGKTPIAFAMQKFEVGRKVNIKINPAIQKGQPHHRFHGYTGTVKGMQGEAYIVHIVEGKKDKNLVILPWHLNAFNPEKKVAREWRDKARIKRERKHTLGAMKKKVAKAKPKKSAEKSIKKEKPVKKPALKEEKKKPASKKKKPEVDAGKKQESKKKDEKEAKKPAAPTFEIIE